MFVAILRCVHLVCKRPRSIYDFLRFDSKIYLVLIHLNTRKYDPSETIKGEIYFWQDIIFMVRNLRWSWTRIEKLLDKEHFKQVVAFTFVLRRLAHSKQIPSGETFAINYKWYTTVNFDIPKRDELYA